MSRSRASWLEVDISKLYFTHSRVRPFFSGCGRRLEETLQMISRGEMSLDSLPQITVLSNTMPDGTVYYFSLNNRRLWVLKQLHAQGYFKGKLLVVRTKEALPRERERYTIDRCSLTAKVMRESNVFINGEEGEDEDVNDLELEENSRDNSIFALKSLSMEENITGHIETTCEVLSATSPQILASLQAPATKSLSSGAIPEIKATSSKKSPSIPKLVSVPLALPEPVRKEVKALSSMWTKGKKGEAKVRSQVDEWIEAGIIQASQEAALYALITNG